MHVGQQLAERATAALPHFVQHFLHRSVWLVAPLLAWPLTIWISDTLGQLFIFPFIVATMVVAYLCGWVQIVLALMVSSLLTAYMAHPEGTFLVTRPVDLARLLVLNLFGILNGSTIYVTKRQRWALLVQARDTLASEERYRRIVETANEGVWFMDREGNTRYANTKMAELLRIPHEELLRSSFVPFIHPADLTQILTRRERVLSGENSQADCRLMRHDGAIGWFLTCCAPMRDLDGTVVGLLALFTDITKRKEHEERLQLAMDVANLAYWDWDVVNDQIIWSTFGPRFFGDPPESLEQFLSRVHEEDREQVRARITAALYEEAPFRTEFRYRGEHNREVFIESHGMVQRDDHGRPIRMIGVSRDVSPPMAIPGSPDGTPSNRESE